MDQKLLFLCFFSIIFFNNCAQTQNHINNTRDLKEKYKTGNELVKKEIDELYRKSIVKTIKKNEKDITSCYLKALARLPFLNGKVVVSFSITKKGNVHQPNIKYSNLNDKRMENCIINKFYNWTFPEPYNGGIVEVSYPFVMMTQ